MSYQTGTATDFDDLKTKIIGFCTGNGFTDEASVGLLKKAGTSIFVKFYSSATAYIYFETSSNSDGLGNLTPVNVQTRSAMIPYYMADPNNITWPINYHFHYYAPENCVFIVMEYNNGYHQWMAFGEIEKAMTFTGGLYAASSMGSNSGNVTNANAVLIWDWDRLGISVNSSADDDAQICPLPFWGFADGSSSTTLGHHLYATIPGQTQTLWGTSMGVTSNMRFSAEHARPFRERSYGTWANAVILSPFFIILREQWGSGNGFYLGRLSQIRFCRMRFRNPGEVITIGPDKWKLYPAYLLNSNSPTPSTNDKDSGDLGIAVRYDGP